MMLCPDDYRKNLENKSIEYLIIERNRLINYMERFEYDELPDDYEESDYGTVYMFHYLYLRELCDLIYGRISDKFQKKRMIFDFDD